MRNKSLGIWNYITLVVNYPFFLYFFFFLLFSPFLNFFVLCCFSFSPIGLLTVSLLLLSDVYVKLYYVPAISPYVSLFASG